MKKTYKYSNCTVTVNMPKKNNDEKVHKATEVFLKTVLKERGDYMKLYPHQIEVLKATEDKNRVGYFLDMGLG